MFATIARQANLMLVAGLVVGIAFPGLAIAMRPWIAPMIAGLLFLSALRVGPRNIAATPAQLGNAVGLALIFQLALPLLAMALFFVTRSTGDFSYFILLMLAAAPISGSPNITALTGNDPAPALRQLIVGTALLPLTVLPIFWPTEAFGSPAAVLWAVGKLLALIAAAAAAAYLLRETVLKQPSPRALANIDGISVLALAVVVIGLMSAVGPALQHDPVHFGLLLTGICAINFALQIGVALACRATGRPALAAPLGIVAGNRNIALFLTVLPPELVDALLIYIGCYQVPMYLTPAVLGRFYRPDPR